MIASAKISKTPYRAFSPGTDPKTEVPEQLLDLDEAVPTTEVLEQPPRFYITSR
jgi:hypothetical protein